MPDAHGSGGRAEADPAMSAGRSETWDEKMDRNWVELLQELRVCQTGVQLIAGFLLTLPFTGRFQELGPFTVGLYLGLVLLAVLTTGLTLTPISIHRRLFRRHVKERLVRSAHRIMQVVLGAIALLITGIAVLIFDVVTERPLALGVGAALLVVLAVLMVALPLGLARAGDDAGGRHPDRPSTKPEEQ